MEKQEAERLWALIMKHVEAYAEVEIINIAGSAGQLAEAKADEASARDDLRLALGLDDVPAND